MPSGPSNDPGKKHLFVVCSNPCAESKVVLVSVTGWTNDLCDGTTRLVPGCHDFINKDSWIMYRACRIVSADQVESGLADGSLIPKADMPDPPLGQIIDGILKSPHTKQGIKRYLR